MSALIYDRMLNGDAKLAVIGLGYVGLPIALDFARKIKVVGFDINQQRVDMMKNSIDPIMNWIPQTLMAVTLNLRLILTI